MPPKIVYYKSVLCPRCLPTNRMLKAFQQKHPEVRIEVVEVVAHPKRAKDAGVRHVPTLVIGAHRLEKAVPLAELEALVFGDNADMA